VPTLHEPTRLGTVQDVRGASVSVVLDQETVSGLSFIDGHAYRIGQVGSFVRIPIGYTELYGVVSQVGAGAVPEKVHEVEPFGHRWMTVQLVGESARSRPFQRGVSQHPTIGDAVHLVSEKDLEYLYGARDAPDCLRVGRLANAESVPALINVDRLVSRHSVVVGNTGSGKSTTVARLLRAIVDPGRFPSARVLVLDIHGEYAGALREHSHVLAIGGSGERTARPMQVPYWAMQFDELLPLTLGALDDRERSAVQEEIVLLKREALATYPRLGVDDRTLTVDSPVPFSIHELWFRLHRLVNATHTTTGTGQSTDTEALLLDNSGEPVEVGDARRVIAPRYRPQQPQAVFLSGSPLNLRKPVDALAARLRDPRLAFLFEPGPWTVELDGSTGADLDEALREWLSLERPICIFDLSGVPPSILQVLLGALLRIVYDALFWGRRRSEGGRERPLLIVLEEAHAYLSGVGDSPASGAARRIIREGRKYGVGMMVVSQRPSEIDQTVLSQCGTLFALRLGNSRDRNHVAATVSENLTGFLDALPVLRTGEAIVVGEAVHLPMRMLIEPLPDDSLPESDDPRIYESAGPGGWNRRREPSDLRGMVESWRRQNPRATGVEGAGGAVVDRRAVTSSAIASVGYDAGRAILEVEWRNGHVYQYFDVPEHEHTALLEAPSLGTYLNDNIKGTYRYVRL
jgi:uncharacterized protein